MIASHNVFIHPLRLSLSPEFGGMSYDDDLDIEDYWEGPISERAREGGGDYQDHKNRDEL